MSEQNTENSPNQDDNDGNVFFADNEVHGEDFEYEEYPLQFDEMGYVMDDYYGDGEEYEEEEQEEEEIPEYDPDFDFDFEFPYDYGYDFDYEDENEYEGYYMDMKHKGRYGEPAFGSLDSFNMFPPLTDPGLDEIFNYTAPEPIYGELGYEKYIEMCKYLEIVPISRVIKSLSTDTLDLKYYGLTVNQMRAIAATLATNSNIKHFILQDNWMPPQSSVYIGDILSESASLTVLNLRECRIGKEGAEKICDGIASTQILNELDLGYNDIGDEGLQILRNCLSENSSIRKLNLSHNNLTEASGETLEFILLENKAMEELDLCWNAFCTGPGNKRLCNGLTKNEQIKWLNLSWNGIGTSQSIIFIMKYLRKSKIKLNYLDLSNNRIAGESLKKIRLGFFKNKTLNEVKMGNNIYTPDEAYSLTTILTNPKSKSPIKILNLENMTVNKDFLTLVQKAEMLGKTVTFGRILSNYIIKGPNLNQLLFNRIHYLCLKPKKKKAKKNFGHFVLALPDERKNKEDFKKILKSKKIKKLDEDLITELVTRFVAPKSTNIDFKILRAAYMELFPDTILPPPPEKKKKKGKKEKKKKKE